MLQVILLLLNLVTSLDIQTKIWEDILFKPPPQQKKENDLNNFRRYFYISRALRNQQGEMFISPPRAMPEGDSNEAWELVDGSEIPRPRPTHRKDDV